MWDKCITSSKLYVLAHLGYNQDAKKLQAHGKPQPSQQNAYEVRTKARIGHGLFGQAKVNVDNMFVCRLLCQFFIVYQYILILYKHAIFCNHKKIVIHLRLLKTFKRYQRTAIQNCIHFLSYVHCLYVICMV